MSFPVAAVTRYIIAAQMIKMPHNHFLSTLNVLITLIHFSNCACNMCQICKSCIYFLSIPYRWKTVAPLTLTCQNPPHTQEDHLAPQNICLFFISTGKNTITNAESHIPPAPNHKIPELLSARNCAPAYGATIPAIRPRQDNIPLTLPR